MFALVNTPDNITSLFFTVSLQEEAVGRKDVTLVPADIDLDLISSDSVTSEPERPIMTRDGMKNYSASKKR